MTVLTSTYGPASPSVGSSPPSGSLPPSHSPSDEHPPTVPTLEPQRLPITLQPIFSELEILDYSIHEHWRVCEDAVESSRTTPTKISAEVILQTLENEHAWFRRGRLTVEYLTRGCDHDAILLLSNAMLTRLDGLLVAVASLYEERCGRPIPAITESSLRIVDTSECGWSCYVHALTAA